MEDLKAIVTPCRQQPIVMYGMCIRSRDGSPSSKIVMYRANERGLIEHDSRCPKRCWINRRTGNKFLSMPPSRISIIPPTTASPTLLRGKWCFWYPKSNNSPLAGRMHH